MDPDLTTVVESLMEIASIRAKASDQVETLMMNLFERANDAKAVDASSNRNRQQRRHQFRQIVRQMAKDLKQSAKEFQVAAPKLREAVESLERGLRTIVSTSPELNRDERENLRQLSARLASSLENDHQDFNKLTSCRDHLRGLEGLSPTTDKAIRKTVGAMDKLIAQFKRQRRALEEFSRAATAQLDSASAN